MTHLTELFGHASRTFPELNGDEGVVLSHILRPLSHQCDDWTPLRCNITFCFIITGKKSPLTMSSSAAESESQHATDASMNSTGSQESGRRRRRHLRRRSSRSAHVMRWRQGIIPRMLASEGSLLNMALRRANFTQARQVIKVRHRK